MMVFLVILVGTGAHADYPPLVVDFTYQQTKGSQGFFPTRVHCESGKFCIWTNVVMNQCIGDTFYPKIESFNTMDGSLRVTEAGANTYKFEFPLESEMQVLVKVICKEFHGRKLCSEVQDVRGTLVKNSLVTGNLETINYVRTKADASPITLKCSKVQTNH